LKLLSRRKKIVLITLAVFVFLFFTPLQYQSEMNVCGGGGYCGHVIVFTSLTRCLIGGGGILYYPVEYTIADGCMYGTPLPAQTQ
jgi:hypothetical protein